MGDSTFVSSLKKTIAGLACPILSRDQFTGDSCTEAVQMARQALKDNGVLIIRGCNTRAACAAGQEAAYRAWERDIKPSIDTAAHGAKVDAAKTIYDVQEAQQKVLWPTGVVGNKGFGFLYAQPEAKADYHATKLGDLDHPDSELTTAILFQVTRNVGGMMSQNSFKTFRGVMPVPHVDNYPTSESFNRVQAMVIGYREGDVRLMFGRTTHQPDISALYRNKSTAGFTSLSNPDAIVDVLEAADAIVIPEPGDIERYVVGTHNPSGSLTQTQLETLSGMAESGFILHPYVGPKSQFGPANANTFHRKTTQFYRRRVQPRCEKKRFAAATKSCQAKVHKLTDRRRQLYGLQVKNPGCLFVDPLAQRVYTVIV
ncbi:hypothetical protein SARC_07277 [Sphaeroforma arctica JP610]|uniref:Uncharacterized protein n=1 Tax=Sphaeroforma arctica JP610 TaxID=667725 RepID=A0A0L0FUL7_9EUKA|nr:hypothetical protein SARC_07277 [Sphaeroforma arctica JP610]KNC80359.1 hypothetical protein SARC_07277 [Sphaeroforma arctica JP610]|eukprot:XP_014154261.1 hypothetical protein SARC_07277 [Sphaeroforma arctica JP610]